MLGLFAKADKLLNHNFNIGDLIEVFLENEKEKYVYSSIDLFLNSSSIGKEKIKSGDIGLLVEKPTVWGRIDIIFGILFSDKVKYVHIRNIKFVK